MGSKARKREARAAAAKSRDSWMFNEGTRHASTIRHLSRIGEVQYRNVQQKAMNVLNRPPMRGSIEEHNQALVVLGAMATMERDKVRDQVQPMKQPSVNELRAAIGKDPVEHGELTIAEYAMKVRPESDALTARLSESVAKLRDQVEASA